MDLAQGLYIHIPFCVRKCFYCSFVVSIAQEERIDQYLSCLDKEARHYAGERITSLYWGGGTPTHMSKGQLKRLSQIMKTNFYFDGINEWTIEANPESIDKEKLNILKEQGVNRVSLGVQTFNEGFLKFLGRNHNADSALDAFDRIRSAGFSNVNVDLMFGLPGQTMEDLENDLQIVRSLNPEHVSLYSLTIEEPSRFFVQHMVLPDNEYTAAQYTFIIEALKQSGFEHYEVSNFAKKGYESTHNINYWQGGNYIGLGVGAHSHINGYRWWNRNRLNEYIAWAGHKESIKMGHEQLNSEERAIERLLFGLRMNKGLSTTVVESLPLPNEQKASLDRFIKTGFIIKNNGNIRVSDKGRLVLDELCAQLI